MGDHRDKHRTSVLAMPQSARTMLRTQVRCSSHALDCFVLAAVVKVRGRGDDRIRDTTI